MIKIGATEEKILKDIMEQIADSLGKAGIFYRVFGRIKTPTSLDKKITKKLDEYQSQGKKLQDVFGVRVTLYFLDDEKIAESLIKKVFDEVPDAHSIDKPGKETFGPVRNNLIFRITESHISTSNLFDHEFVDSTFEVQLRTIFSEGWHEVEHDLRYKCKEDWKDEDVLSRQLNGQLAVLETSDWAILKIFDEMAYRKYKKRDWNSFLRNVLRIRFEDDSLSQNILKILNEKPFIAKQMIRSNREKMILSLVNLTKRIPLKMDTVLFIINRSLINDEDIIRLESDTIKTIFSEN